MINADGGYTQPEQIEELGQVVAAMSRHLGDDFRRANGHQWSLEDQDADYRPVICSGETYRYRITLEYIHGLPREEVHAAGEAITAELGLTPNANNHTGSTEMDRPAVFGAGNSESRFLRVRGDDSKIQVLYQTRCSDHHTMYETFERFAEEHRQELREQYSPPPGLGPDEDADE
ncbi:hypothetical protein [Nesterenkonia sp. K-15-9-6]|uniref:hypothetical protein n=1 Tax=Nesterenkonia sp. K-15-9-6 TaxID=3093918 RepID=UPI0040439EE4